MTVGSAPPVGAPTVGAEPPPPPDVNAAAADAASRAAAEAAAARAAEEAAAANAVREAAAAPPTLVVGRDLTDPPTKLHDVAAVMPPVAKQAGMQGTVMIRLTIGVDGRVENADVTQSHPFFNKAALDAVRQWTFAPTRAADGRPARVVMNVRFVFKPE